jgi:hypothetical protein
MAGRSETRARLNCSGAEPASSPPVPSAAETDLACRQVLSGHTLDQFVEPRFAAGYLLAFAPLGTHELAATLRTENT